jgi:hypothetical protein
MPPFSQSLSPERDKGSIGKPDVSCPDIRRNERDYRKTGEYSEMIQIDADSLLFLCVFAG